MAKKVPILKIVVFTIGPLATIAILGAIIEYAKTTIGAKEKYEPVVAIAQEESASQASEEKTKREKVEANFIKSGMYKVGSDIEEGIYLIFSESSLGYWQISKDSSGTLESIIANDNIKVNGYADLRDGDYFKLVGAKAIKRDLFLYKPIDDGSYAEGTYKVGLDIEPGEYKLKMANGASMSYWERTKSARGDINSIIANDNFSGSVYVTVQSGEYFKIIDADAEKVK